MGSGPTLAAGANLPVAGRRFTSALRPRPVGAAPFAVASLLTFFIQSMSGASRSAGRLQPWCSMGTSASRK